MTSWRGEKIALLEVSGLTVGLTGQASPILRDVDWALEPGEIVGLVGESGSGKTLASLALMGMLPPAMALRSGSVVLDGRQLVSPEGVVERASGDLTMIFQNPRASLNPSMRVGRQIARALVVNRGLSKSEAGEEAVRMLETVRIAGAARVARAYPHQLSGGMCQRVMIAIALACQPKVLIADEPTTALDVTIQAQIFELIRSLVAETAAVLFITHDLGAVAEMCERVVVLYGGQVMETGRTTDLLSDPKHPYTRYLLAAAAGETDPRVAELGADFTLPGCRFANRCPYVMEVCSEIPPRYDVGPGRESACFLHAEEITHAST